MEGSRYEKGQRGLSKSKSTECGQHWEKSTEESSPICCPPWQRLLTGLNGFLMDRALKVFIMNTVSNLCRLFYNIIVEIMTQ